VWSRRSGPPRVRCLALPPEQPSVGHRNFPCSSLAAAALNWPSQDSLVRAPISPALHRRECWDVSPQPMPRQTIRVKGKIATKPAGNSTLAGRPAALPEVVARSARPSHRLPAFAQRRSWLAPVDLDQYLVPHRLLNTIRGTTRAEIAQSFSLGFRVAPGLGARRR
jgi:hypothetical protein